MSQSVESKAVQSTCPVHNFDHWDQANNLPSLRPVYADLLAGPPVAWSETHGGFWILGHYEDVRAAASDHKLFSSAQGTSVPPLPRPGVVALEQDPPEHTPFRKLYSEWLNPRAVRALLPMIAELTEHYVTEFAAKGGGDFIADVSKKLPTQIIGRALGIDADRAHEFYILGDVLTHVGADQAERAARLQDFLAACAVEVKSRRANPREDFLTTAMDAQIDGRPITDDELLRWMTGAIFAGHETTSLAGGGMIHQLSLDARLRERLRNEPDIVAPVVGECLRLNSPIQRFFRTLTADVTMHGIAMRAGDKVMLNFASANLDGRVFTDPDELRTDREFTRHVAFGWGLHRCVGSPLATRELEALVTAMVTLTEFEPDGEPTFAGPIAMGNFIGIAELPLRCRLR